MQRTASKAVESGACSRSSAGATGAPAYDLFNKAPPMTETNPAADLSLGQLRGGTFAPGLYDTNGRRFYPGANIRF